jgi:uncharacterized protein
MARVAVLLYRLRLPLCALIVVGFIALVPKTNFTNINNDLTMWVAKTDPVYVTYERFRNEFGGQRNLIVALRSDRLFTPESLDFIRAITADIERVTPVDRVQSLATANIVRTLPAAGPDEESGIEVQPLLGETPDAASALRVKDTVLGDPLLRGDLVSEDGTVTAIVVTFDEDNIDEVRAGVIEKIHQLIDPRLPEGMRAFYNGSLEISETYNRVTLANTKNLTAPILVLMVAGIFFLFRSWRITGLLVVATLVSVIWTMGLFVMMGFSYNVLASMLPALAMILAVADDVHIVQHFVHELRDSGNKRHAFVSTVEHLFLPLFGASATTALGLLSLATSNVVAVRSFGVGAAVGVMVDFVMSIVLVPTLLLLVTPDVRETPQERYLVGPLQRLARFSVRHAAPVAVVTVLLMLVAAAGAFRVRVDTNHINFFAEDHPLHQSARVIDSQLSGIYSYSILLEGPPDSMKTPDTLRRMEVLRERLEAQPFTRKVVSVADYVKRVNQELSGGQAAARVVPEGAEAIAQELFVFGLSDEGRRELERVVSTDFSKAQVAVKLASASSDLVFEEIDHAERIAGEVFAGSGITTVATGSGRIFSTLDHYLVMSQLSSFGTAFLTVFAVIFAVFRSVRFGILGIIANALPVAAVLGMMGWLGISLNIATVMVASVALGIVDDDTIHFVARFRREAAAGASSAEAIEIATAHEGRASLTTAVVNSLAYSVMLTSSYRPTAWFGGLLALTMAVAFLVEVFVVPALIVLIPRVFGAERFSSARATAA